LHPVTPVPAGRVRELQKSLPKRRRRRLRPDPSGPQALAHQGTTLAPDFNHGEHFMPSTRTTRSSSKARDEIISLLKDDHKRVKKAYRDFKKLDGEENPEACAELVQRVLAELTVHAELEEELLYPAAREAIAEEDLIDEAEVEHESMRTLIGQLKGMDPGDEKYAARFTVLCEYTMHHVKEEEGEMFPQLQRVRLDWEGLAAEMTSRREELMSEAGIAPEGEAGEDTGVQGGGGDGASRGAAQGRGSSATR
jgi:hemerythrin superfamily protein